MVYPVFPKPSEIIADEDSRGKSLVAYARTARAVLADGTLVRPVLSLVRDIVDLYRDSGLDFPTAVSPDNYSVVHDIACIGDAWQPVEVNILKVQDNVLVGE